MKAILNKNYFEVEYKGEKGFVLVSDEEIKENDWCFDCFINKKPISIFRCNEDQLLNIQTGTDSLNFKIIGSTFLLEGVPLIILEEEVQNLAIDYLYLQLKEDKFTDLNIVKYKAFIQGYNQFKSKYKYTEEDLIKAIELGMNNIYMYQNTDCEKLNFSLEKNESVETLIKYINQPKELEFKMVQDFSNRSCETCCLSMNNGICDANMINNCISNTGNIKHPDYWSSKEEDDSDYQIFRLDKATHPTHPAGQLIII